MTRRSCLIIVAVALVLSGSAGQDRPPPSALQAKEKESKPNWQKQVLSTTAQRGTAWLKRVQRGDGRFPFGFVPALNRYMDGDDYLTQAGAAFALARASRVLKDERGAAQAQQALLTLLLDTRADSKSADVRVPTAPLVNPLAAAGLLVAAIHELPTPGKDLLDQADQLCQFIRGQQQADGSLKSADGTDAASANVCSGMALYGVIRSYQHRPAAWKLELVRKAQPHYLAWWRANKNPLFVPWHTAAYAEAFLHTKDKAFADGVGEMNDWLCTLQYQNADQNRSHWRGGFMTWQDGKALTLMPTIQAAFWTMSLAEACRTARHASDAARWTRYSQALEAALVFVATLQYTQANTSHYADAYKDEILLGGFHASHQDGNLRLDYTQHALAGLLHYLQYVADAQ